MEFWLCFVLFITSITSLLLIYAKKSKSYWKNRNVPYLEPSFLFGNLSNPFTNNKYQADYAKEFYFKFKEMGLKYGGIYLYGSPALVSVDPLYNKYILAQNSNNFQHRGFYNNEKHQPVSANLFTRDGDKWRTSRMKFTPAFTSAKMKLMFDLMVEASKFMEEHVKEQATKKLPINATECVSCFIVDVIGSCAFGIDCNSFEDTTFRNMLTDMFAGATELIKISFCFAVPKVAEFLRIPLFPWKVTKFLCNSINDTIKYRTKERIRGNDFLQMSMEMKDENIIDMDELHAQSIMFFAAGYETSATAFTFLLLELAINQEIQDKLRNKIQEVLARHNQEISYEAVNSMKYLEMVLCETLRKHSPFAVLNRKCAENFTLPNSKIVIEKGTLILIPVIGIHNDPEYFPNPNKFDPERFSEENKSKILPYTYLPFGEGPRACVGYIFGRQQIKIGIFNLLRNYSFKLNLQTKLLLELNPFLCPNTTHTILLDVEKFGK